MKVVVSPKLTDLGGADTHIGDAVSYMATSYGASSMRLGIVTKIRQFGEHNVPTVAYVGRRVHRVDGKWTDVGSTVRYSCLRRPRFCKIDSGSVPSELRDLQRQVCDQQEAAMAVVYNTTSEL